MHHRLRQNVTLAFLSLTTVLTNCTSFQSVQNSSSAREHLTEDLEDQIMFNLIRARNGLPFAHYDVVSVQSLVTSKITPEAGSGYSVTESTSPGRSVQTNRGANGLVSSVSTTVDAASAVARSVSKPFTYGISGERSNQVTIDVEPIFDEPKIYEAYVEFLNYTGAPPPKKTSSGAPVMFTAQETKTTGKDPLTGKEIALTETITQPQGESPKVELGIHFGDILTVAESEKHPKSSYIPRTVKKWEGKWYYIPEQYRPQFSKLCMKLVARGAAYSDGGITILPGPASKSSPEQKALRRLESTFKSLRALGL